MVLKLHAGSVGIKEQLKLMDDEIAKFATKENDSKLGDESIHHLEEDMASLKIKEEMKDEGTTNNIISYSHIIVDLSLVHSDSATGEVKSNVAARDIPRKVMIQHNIGMYMYTLNVSVILLLALW